MTNSSNTFNYHRTQKILKRFSEKNIAKVNFHFYFTLIMFWLSVFANYYFLNSISWMLFLTIPITTVFMCRSYVIEHDCGHLIFYNKTIWNDIAGNIVGFGIAIPYSMWKCVHDSHHMHVGNLDKRDFNPEIWTLTISEFKKAKILKKTLYKFVRSRFVRLVVSPVLNYGIACRLIHPNFSRKAKISVIAHNVIYSGLIWYIVCSIGFLTFFYIYLFPLILFFIIAAYTFYGQHQFEETYWRKQENWDWKDASSFGATDLQAPRWYRWLVGNVTYHTVHHLYVKIPFYNLHEAQNALKQEMAFNEISITGVWRLLGLKVWDEQKKKLVTFKEAKI